MSTKIDQAIALLKEAYDCIDDDEADRDTTAAAIRSACRMGLDASTENATARKRPTLASWGQPDRRCQKWMLHFEDTEVGSIVYDASLYGEAEAELLARDAYRRAQVNWNCTLLRVATLDPAQEDVQLRRADALEESLRELRTTVEKSEPNHRNDVEMRLKADVALGDVLPGQLPIARVVACIRPASAKLIAEKQRELKRHLDSIKLYERLDGRDPPEDEAEREQRRQRRQDEAKGTLRLERDIARLQRVASGLVEDATSLLVPLGTLVTIREIGAIVTFETDWPLPIAGSRGVVTGYSTLPGRPNVVSFLADVVNTSGSKVTFNDERPYSVNYLPEELEIVSYGKLHDGSTIDVPGWWPTHGYGTKGDILYRESMVVANGGHRWRIEPCSGPPELTQVTTDDAAGDIAFRHLVPLDGEFRRVEVHSTSERI